jgi:hypothetical protein
MGFARSESAVAAALCPRRNTPWLPASKGDEKSDLSKKRRLISQTPFFQMMSRLISAARPEIIKSYRFAQECAIIH